MIPHQYMAGPHPIMMAQANHSQVVGQMRITPSVPVCAMGDFRARLDSRMPTDRESLVVVSSIL